MAWRQLDFHHLGRIARFVSDDGNRVRSISTIYKTTTFNSLNFVLVAIAWVFFRASNFQTAKQILKNIYTFKPGPLYIGNASYLVYSFFAILFLFAAEYNAEKLNNRYAWLHSERKVLRWSAYLLLILTLLSIGVFNGGQFIYFQF